jgi:GrpB-like predicted nucleotidyltransferase (UPF0157 family)
MTHPPQARKDTMQPFAIGRPTIVIAPYEPSWPERGAQLAAALQATLGPLAIRADHIGSTAVPGMAAKPIFDLQVSVRDLTEATQAFDGPLRALEFIRLPWKHDHVPAGCDDDPARWAKRLWVRVQPGRDRVNLHCRLVGSPNERLALLFRDWLRVHPRAVAAYAQFKKSLAEAVDDIDVYTEIKDPVVDVIAVAAENWAQAVGWTP